MSIIQKGTLKIIERRGNALNGNPCYLVSVAGIEATTLGQEITNYEGKQVVAWFGPVCGRPNILKAMSQHRASRFPGAGEVTIGIL